MPLRSPTPTEVAILDRLAAAWQETTPKWVRDVLVEEMDDGGMGSLRLAFRDGIARSTKGARIVSELLFDDVDGIRVIASLFVGKDNIPCELDMWKVDYSPLKQVPSKLPDAQKYEYPS